MSVISEYQEAALNYSCVIDVNNNIEKTLKENNEFLKRFTNQKVGLAEEVFNDISEIFLNIKNNNQKNIENIKVGSITEVMMVIPDEVLWKTIENKINKQVTEKFLGKPILSSKTDQNSDVEKYLNIKQEEKSKGLLLEESEEIRLREIVNSYIEGHLKIKIKNDYREIKDNYDNLKSALKENIQHLNQENYKNAELEIRNKLEKWRKSQINQGKRKPVKDINALFKDWEKSYNKCQQSALYKNQKEKYNTFKQEAKQLFDAGRGTEIDTQLDLLLTNQTETITAQQYKELDDQKEKSLQFSKNITHLRNKVDRWKRQWASSKIS